MLCGGRHVTDAVGGAIGPDVTRPLQASQVGDDNVDVASSGDAEHKIRLHGLAQ